MQKAGYVRAASGLTCPPQAQEMAAVAAEPRDLDALQQQLAAKELVLVTLSEELCAAEQTLLAAMQQQEQLLGGRLAAADDTLMSDQQAAACGGVGGAPPSWLAARWQLLAAQRAELALRWQCLLEDKRQLRAAASGRGVLRGDFEPGETPMRDVTCAVITHQLDTPCFSCCFQR